MANVSKVMKARSTFEVQIDSIKKFENFERNGKVFMKNLLQSKMTEQWKAELAKQSAEAWFNDVAEFVPDEVKNVFNGARPPTPEELRSLPYSGHAAGVYMDILKRKRQPNDMETQPTSSAHIGSDADAMSSKGYALYPGCTSLRDVRLRLAEHNSPHAVGDGDWCRYYELRWDTKDWETRFVTLVRIPIPHSLDSSEKRRRRLLCRLSEALFLSWTLSYYAENKLTNSIASYARSAWEKCYGSEMQIEALDYGGCASHSPLMETLGVHDMGTLINGRKTEIVGTLADIYGGVENIPVDLERKMTTRAERDGVALNQMMDRKRKERTEDDMTKIRKRSKQQWAKKTPEQKKESWEQRSAVLAAQWDVMTDGEKQDKKDSVALKTRKYKVNRALKSGKITQAQCDAAKANDWFETPDFPRGWAQP